MTHSANEGIAWEDALTSTGKKRVEAILFTESNQIEFGVLATDTDYDLCALGRQTKGIPQYIPPVQPDENLTLFDDREVVDYPARHKRRRWQ